MAKKKIKILEWVATMNERHGRNKYLPGIRFPKRKDRGIVVERDIGTERK